jgi:hypothetical protein
MMSYLRKDFWVNTWDEGQVLASARTPYGYLAATRTCG